MARRRPAGISAFAVARRAIRYRPGRSALVVATAALAVAAAAATAGYVRAGHASLLADAIGGAPTYATQVSLVATGAEPPSPADGVAALRAARLPAGLFGEPIGAVSTEVTVPVPGGAPAAGGPAAPGGAVTPGGAVVAATLAHRDGFCAHVTLVGACASAPGEVMVSSRTAGVAVGARLGGRVVVGIYTPRDPGEPYWGAVPYFSAGPDPVGVRIDAVFAGVASDVRGALVSVRVDAELVGVHLDDLVGLRAGLRRLAGEARGFTVVTGLADVIAGAGRDGGTFDLAVALVGVPLVLLCLAVLAAVAGALATERAPEIALATLRGFPPGRAARHRSVETLLLVALATPVGLAAGAAAVEVAARSALAAGVGVEARWPVLLAGLGTAGVAALAVWVVTVRTGRRPPLDLMRRVGRRPPRGGWTRGGWTRGGWTRGGWTRGGWIGVVAFAAACATVTAASVDRASPVAWLATPSVALLLGLGAAGGLGAAARRTLARPATGGRVVRLLVGAWLARAGRPVPAALASVAVALLVFGALGWDAGAIARADRADDVVGADRVFAVSAAYPTALVAAVNAADPGGHSMAVARTTQRFAGTDVDVIGVDAARLAGVVRWRGMSAPQLVALAAALVPKAAPALVTDGRVSVTVTVRGATPGGVEIGALLAVPGGAPVVVPLGPLADGRATLTAADAVAACRSGCRLTGLTLAPTRPGAGRVRADVRVTELRVGGQAAVLDSPDAWRSADGLAVTAGRALRLMLDSADLGPRVARYVDAPPALPAAVTGPPPGDAIAFSFPGLRDNAQPFTVVSRPSRVPRAGERALLFDLTYAVRAAEAAGASGDEPRYEVWVGPGAPADLARRLAGRGVTVLATQTRAGYLAALDRAAPALGLGFYLGAGAVALLFAALLGVLDPLLGASRRAAELAALGLAGVGRRALGRAVTTEAVLTASTAWLVGAATGVAGAIALAGSATAGPATSTGPGPLGALPAAPITVTWSGAIVGAVIGSLAALAAVVAAARRPLRAARDGDLGRAGAGHRPLGVAGHPASGVAGHPVPGVADQSVPGVADLRAPGVADQNVPGVADQSVTGSTDHPAIGTEIIR